VRVLDTDSTVIVRLDRTIQYAAASRSVSGVSGTLDPRWSLSSGSLKARPGGGDDEKCGMTKIRTMGTRQ
jgi:hypothetical protein